MTGPAQAGGGAARRVTIVVSDLGGGTGDHLLSMLPHWDAARWSARLVSEAPLTSRLVPSVPVSYVGPVARWLRFPLAQLVTGRRVAACLRREPADLVHSYFFWSIMYGRMLKARGRVRALVENREDEGFSWGRREYALLRWTRGLPDRVICVSEAVRRVALAREGLDPARVEVVLNGVAVASASAAEARRARAELGYGEGDLVVGMVSNFERAIKGVSYFIEALPQIAREAPAARFVIFGRGRNEPALRARAAELGVTERLRFAGFRHDIERFYPALDLSVLTSLSEGLSIALLESMKHGVPVVATRVGGNPEVVADGETGFLVPPRDPGAFADRVIAVLGDPELRARLGGAARRRVAERFDVRQAARRYLEIYDQALALADRRV